MDTIVITQEFTRENGPVTVIAIEHEDGTKQVIWMCNWITNIKVDNTQVSNEYYKLVNGEE